MQVSRYSKHIRIDGDRYMKGFLGLSWFPSEAARISADRYEQWVDHTLTTLWRKFTSSRVIMAISDAKGTVTVIPRDHSPDPTQIFPTPYMDRLCNAAAVPKNPRDAIREGRDWYEPNKDYPTLKTTGKGSDVDVPFMPWLFDKASCGAVNPFHNQPDSVLLHELMHCLGSLRGRGAKTDGAPNPFDNLEEFTAIVIENIYQSENHATILRGGHGSEILPADLMPGEAFYKKYREPMQKVVDNHKDLVRVLRDGKNIAHNPFLYCDM